MDDANELTATGTELAKLPLDPRVGRMILEARSRGALDEVLVIASALSVQDVRDRPMDMQAQADQQHAKFDDEKSEFSGYLKLWKWIDEARGGHGKEHKLSNRQYEQLLRQNFVNVRRVREWRDIHSQLHTVVAEHKWRLNAQPASYEELHKSMLAGLLGNIGVKPEDEDVYLGARGIKFYRHPGAHLRKKPGRWIVCAELVETTRLFGRGIANIEPLWIEQVAGHLLKKQLLDPHWEKKAAEVIVAGTRDAVRPGDLQRPARAVRPRRRAGRARDLHPRRAGRRPVGDEAAVPGRQPEAGASRSRSWNTSRGGRTCWWTRS